MSTVNFTREVLLDAISEQKEQFLWAWKNMLTTVFGTLQHEKWFGLLLGRAQQITELIEMLKNAPSVE